MAMLLARTTARRSVPSLRRGSQRRMLNNDFTVRQTGLDPKGRPYERLGGSSGRMMKGTAMTEWWDPAIMPLYITIGAGCAMCMYVCGLKVTTYPDIVWNKKKDTDEQIFNTGNTATSYHEQRLFLATYRHVSTRLLGGSMYDGGNQIYAHKRGSTKAEMNN